VWIVVGGLGRIGMDWISWSLRYGLYGRVRFRQSPGNGFGLSDGSARFGQSP